MVVDTGQWRSFDLMARIATSPQHTTLSSSTRSCTQVHIRAHTHPPLTHVPSLPSKRNTSAASIMLPTAGCHHVGGASISSSAEAAGGATRPFAAVGVATCTRAMPVSHGFGVCGEAHRFCFVSTRKDEVSKRVSVAVSRVDLTGSGHTFRCCASLHSFNGRGD
jgi:hypothetical protein